MDPKGFSCIENFLPKFKTLRLLLEGSKVTKKYDSLVYVILEKLGPVYYVFVSTLHSTKQAFLAKGTAYKAPPFDAFSISLIREQEKLLHLGLISIVSTSNKA